MLLVLTAPPRTEGYEKLQLLAVLGHERFAAGRQGLPRGRAIQPARDAAGQGRHGERAMVQDGGVEGGQ